MMMSNKRKQILASILLSVLILFQSCTVYHKYSSSLDDAITSNDKVKVVIPSDDPYKFKKIQKIDGEIYGLMYNKSRSYKLLASRKTIPSDKETMTYVQIYENELNDLHLKNKTASTVLSITIPLVVVGALVGAIYSSLENTDYLK